MKMQIFNPGQRITKPIKKEVKPMTNQVKVTEVQKIEYIEDIINTHLYLTKQKDGTYEGEIYADYRDELEEDTMKEILQSIILH